MMRSYEAISIASNPMEHLQGSHDIHKGPMAFTNETCYGEEYQVRSMEVLPFQILTLQGGNGYLPEQTH